jgi:predicted AAA+ superfamily ATPase
MSLKPWRDLAVPHEDVLQGTFQESEFAADLNKVVNKTASAEYLKPLLFFERTYITEGMRLMLESVVKRITGNGGDPVVQLQTAFGGGKTHAMMAVYHMVRGEVPAETLPGVYSILAKMGVHDLPQANVAIIDGNNLSPSEPRQKKGVTVNTLWGEIAWQLGGIDGYKFLEKADRDGTSPGKEILARLFDTFSPAVILMDETVAYIRQFADKKSYAGGTFGSNLAFLQALTEAAGHVPTAMVIASLPESDLEAGGERGKQALKQIEHLFHRLEAIWKPVSTHEGFEIVRRRIFSELKDHNQKEEVCNAFAQMYSAAGNYPAETSEVAYLDRLNASYPVHPEVFDRLYEDWASMENFQRTRGVLRLMAMIVHRLWTSGNRDMMIMPGSLPFDDIQVRTELVRYLPVGWDPVVERDVDGPKSATMEIDKNDPRLGAVEAARRVSRTIFLGSAPASSGQRIRGLNAEHIRLGCTQPEQSPGVFDDALKRLNDKLYYLYSGQDRFWFDTQTNLRREAEDRIHRFDHEADVLPEIASRLKTMFKGQPFSGVHVFAQHGDIPDDSGLRLVILPPKASHLWKQKNTQAMVYARKFLDNRGKQPRLNRNRLIFLCADEDTKNNVYEHTRRLLAWQSIIDDKAALNLDHHRLREATQNLKDFDRRLEGSVAETYKWLLAPLQEANGKGGVKDLEWEAVKLTPNNGNTIHELVRVMKENELAIAEWSPYHLKSELDKWFFKEARCDYGLQNLWDDFCRYPYLPRLIDREVLQNTVAAGIKTRDFFGYSTGKENNRYTGLKFGESGKIYVDESSMIVSANSAASQIYAGSRTGGGYTVDVKAETEGVTSGERPITPWPPEGGATMGKTVTRFHGSVSLDAISAAMDFANITQEIIQHFSSDQETKVNIYIEIQAGKDSGFNESVIRTVTENSKSLGFVHADFEKD